MLERMRLVFIEEFMKYKYILTKTKYYEYLIMVIREKIIDRFRRDIIITYSRHRQLHVGMYLTIVHIGNYIGGVR